MGRVPADDADASSERIGQASPPLREKAQGTKSRFILV
jgi:hypothetical protein